MGSLVSRCTERKRENLKPHNQTMLSSTPNTKVMASSSSSSSSSSAIVASDETAHTVGLLLQHLKDTPREQYNSSVGGVNLNHENFAPLFNERIDVKGVVVAPRLVQKYKGDAVLKNYLLKRNKLNPVMDSNADDSNLLSTAQHKGDKIVVFRHDLTE